MRVYVAGRNVARARATMEALERFGHEVTHDWTQEPKVDPRADPAGARACAEACVAGVRAADRVVLMGEDLQPEAGDAGPLGAIIEAALGAAWKRPTIVVRPARKSVFWHYPGLFRTVRSMGEALRALET